MSGPIQPGSGALTLTGYAPTVTVGLALDVQVLGRKVGTLRRLGDEYVFQYDAGVASEYFVSLAMPVRMQPWVWPRDLHPYLPVGKTTLLHADTVDHQADDVRRQLIRGTPTR